MKLSTVDFFKHVNMGDKAIVLSGETLRKLQLELLLIAKDIIDVCEQENVNYHLTGGSALGAYRHKGFIPWDDDMDIDILGSDFDRFISAFKEKFGEKYWIHTWEERMCISRIRLKGSIFKAREDIGNEECGFYVDIPKIENVFDNTLARNVHGVFCMGFGFALSCRVFFRNKDFLLKLVGNNKKAKKVFYLKIFIGSLLSFLSAEKWTKLTYAIYGLCKNNDSKYVSVPSGRKHYFGEMRLRKDFVETRKCEFEGYMWNVPKDIEGYLTSMYGDYMKIPEENEREAHIILDLKFPE